MAGRRLLGDEWRLFLDDPATIEDDLPPVARPFARDPSWLEQFVAGFDRLAARLGGDDNHDVFARCTAEELALHLVIDLAEAFAIYGVIELRALPHLPDHGEDDVSFGFMRDALFEDNDVLMLFNPTLDGIEQDDQLGAAHLHPIRWFLPFR